MPHLQYYLLYLFTLSKDHQCANCLCCRCFLLTAPVANEATTDACNREELYMHQYAMHFQPSTLWTCKNGWNDINHSVLWQYSLDLLLHKHPEELKVSAQNTHESRSTDTFLAAVENAQPSSCTWLFQVLWLLHIKFLQFSPKIFLY